MENWKMAMADFQKFEGMLGNLDAAVMVSLLDFQKQNQITGPLAEFGVYKGRSAALLARFARKEEPLFLIDVKPYLDKEQMDQINPEYTFIESDSARFVEEVFQSGDRTRFRFVHSDGSHTFENVYKDLIVAKKILSEEGIFVIDDYFNPHYPQVPAALNWFLAKERSDLRVFLLGSNKCYLCRASNHSRMMRFCLDEFRALMTQYGYPVQLSKTDRHPAFDCFSFRGIQQDKVVDEFYGYNLYKLFYDQDRYQQNLSRFSGAKI